MHALSPTYCLIKRSSYVATQSIPTMGGCVASRDHISYSKFQIVHFNIRSLLQHIDELRHFVLQSEPDIIALSET